MTALALKDKTFPSIFIQAPLAGISCAPFRELTWRYSKPAFSCTEMISCKTLIHKPEFAQKRFIHKHPNEGPVCFQLSANNPDELGEAVKRVTDYGADLIDLNCGCPVKKIRSKGAGSRLLTKPDMLYRMIIAMKQNTHLPVSIKIRVERDDEKFNQEVADIVSDAGVDFLTVHGRHWTQHYETPCRYDEIAYFVDRLSIPVIGNGDVADSESLQKMVATGCAGVMIGRAGVGQPWLIAKLQAELAGKTFVMPDAKEIGEMLRDHVLGLVELLGNEKFAILQARSFAKYYGRLLPNRAEFHQFVSKCDNLSDFMQICAKTFV